MITARDTGRVQGRTCRRWLLVVIAVASAAVSSGAQSRPHSATSPDYTVVGENYTFTPGRIVVRAGDVVRITFIARDRPYTFTIDEYRISRRAVPGSPTVIDFCADEPGTFAYYCNLTDDDRCGHMRGELVVR